MSTSGEHGTMFELSLGGADATVLEVASFRGREAVSKPYVFRVTAVAPADEPVHEEDWIGERGALVARFGGTTRCLARGIVTAVRASSDAAHRDRKAYRIKLSPRSELLAWRVTSRIFQDLDVPAIVSKVLEGAGVSHVWRLARPAAPRAYCVQYRESDSEFIHRLLAEEGLYYFFERDASPDGDDVDDRMVLTDSAAFHPPIDEAFGAAGNGSQSPILHRREADVASPTDDRVARFSIRRAVRPRSLLLRDYDFRHPSLALRAEAGEATREHDVYDHRGEHEEPEVSAARASILLAQHRSRAVHGRASSACMRLAPGHRFRLDAGAAPDLSGEYVVTSIDHEGSDGQGKERYGNRFSCIPASTACTPERPCRAQTHVCETAKVVGPPGEEIHVDVHGRIKVQFHWDLDGRDDGKSSAWIRVAQGWAGAGWGMQFVPRAGMEVLVTFVHGDIDCPLVTGCLVNGTHPPPFALPREKTQSGFRTRSTPNGQGYNELSFEDRSGAEVIRLRAERDFESLVQRDRSTTIGHDERVRVGGDRATSVAGSSVELVGGDVDETIEGSRTTIVGGSTDVAVRGSGDVRFAGDLTTIVGGQEHRTIRGRADILLEADAMARAEGSFVLVVGAPDAPKCASIHAEGAAQISGSRLVELTSGESIVFRCGESSIQLTPQAIVLQAPEVIASADTKITIASGETVKVHARDAMSVDAPNVSLRAEAATLALSKTARLTGDKVKLGGKHDPVEDGPEIERPKPTVIELRDRDGAPVPRQRFIVVREDGVELAGVTDDEGRAEVFVEGEAEIAIPAASAIQRG